MATKVNRDKWAVRSSVGVQSGGRTNRELDAGQIESRVVPPRPSPVRHEVEDPRHDEATSRTNEYNWFT